MVRDYNVFEDYVRMKYITDQVLAKIYQVPSPCNGRLMWSDETKSTLEDLLKKGIPARLLNRLSGVTRSTITKLRGAIGDQSEARKELLKEYYTWCLEQDKREPITLDNYLASYDGDLARGVNGVVDSMSLLHQHGIDFPYIPQARDAYLFGANHGNGSLNSDFSIQFSGKNDELDVIDSIMPLSNIHRDEGMIIYPSAIGRLYYLMGLQKGYRQTQDLSIPSWIRGEDFVSEFLGGLFDTVRYVSVKGRRMEIRQFSDPDYEESFTLFMEKIGSMFRESGIDLTEKGVSVTSERGILVGLVRLSYKQSNRRKLRRVLRTKFKSTQKLLEAA